MSGKKPFTDMETREKILQLYNENNYTQRKIARLLHLSPSTVNLWINRQGDINTQKRTGRNRKTTADIDNKIYSLSTCNPFLPCTDINRQLCLNVSNQTIRNRLIERGLRNFKASKKPFLTEKHKTKRLEFALKFVHWTEEKWENVCFADEKVFQSYGNGFINVWRPKLNRWTKTKSVITRYDEIVLSTRKQSGRFSIPIWGCIGKINHIHLINAKHLDKRYFLKNIIKKYLPTNEENFILVHDNSPIHTAKIIKEWLEENNIITLKWPAYSPDLNPIENLWSRMEHLTRNRKPTSREHLWNIVKEAYDKILQDNVYIKKLLRSMPKRLEDVIRANGNITKY